MFVYRSRACWERWHPGKVATVDFAEEIVATVCVWRDPGEQIVLEGVTGCGTQARVSASAYGSCIQDGIINCPYWSFGVILPATVQDVSATFAETSPAHTVLTDAGVPACVSEAPPDCGDPIDPGSNACWRGCETDTDCALVEASACACDEGGRRVAVRADQAMHWPTTTPCAAVNRCSDCDAGYAGARAACVSGRCDVECDGAATACDATDPLAFGACGQALGVAYNGYGCSFVSGCSGAPDAGALYPSLDACRAACTRTCADTAAAIGAFIDENKGCTRSSDCTPVETNYEPAIESCGCTTYLNAGFDRDEWAALDALWSNTGDSTMCGVGSCCDGEVHPPTCFEGLCREGEWPVGPLCSFRSTPADCAADPRCAWLAPGCPPGQHVPTEGCYHACSSGPCPGGFDCVTDDGGACTDATAAPARVCVVL